MANFAGQHLESGTLVSRYKVLEILGAGGFGITYKVYDTRLECEVAMKEYLPAEFAARGGDQTTVMPRSRELEDEYKHGLTRFLDEARTLAKFKNRHIVRVSDYMELNGTAYLVMDYEAGRSLGDLLKRRDGPLSEIEIKNIFIPILDGLKTVHDAGLLHRDIKPDNIYLRSDGPPVLLDFGAARQYTASQSQSVTAIVTPGFAPFEQYQPKAELGAWTDLYALGATMYACLAGKPPVDAITRHAAPAGTDPLPPAVEVGDDRYSEILLKTIDWMLRTSIADRPQSADEVLPCIQGRAEPPQPARPASVHARDSSATPTVRLADSELSGTVGEATQRRAAHGDATAGASAGSGLGTGVIAGAVAAALIGAGAAWWYLKGGEGPAVMVDGGTSSAREPTAREPATEAQTQVAEAAGETARTDETPAASEAAKPETQTTDAAEEGRPTEETQVAGSVSESTGDTAAVQETQQPQPREDETQAAGGVSESNQEAAAVQETQQPQPREDETQAAGGVSESNQEVAAIPDVQQPEQSEDQTQVAGGVSETSQEMVAEQEARESQPDEDKTPSPESTAAESGIASATEVAKPVPAESSEPAVARIEPEDAPKVEQAAVTAQQATSEGAGAMPEQAPAGSGEDKVTGDVEDFLASLTKETSQPGSSGKRAVASGQANAGDPVPGEVGDLLVRAQALLASSNLVVPEGRNARALYLKVLAVDPDNSAALAGMNRIGTVYQQAAEIMLEEGRADVSRQLVNRGLDAVPNHQGLMALRTKTQGQ
jgi:hypothetical protein